MAIKESFLEGLKGTDIAVAQSKIAALGYRCIIWPSTETPPVRRSTTIHLIQSLLNSYDPLGKGIVAGYSVGDGIIVERRTRM